MQRAHTSVQEALAYLEVGGVAVVKADQLIKQGPLEAQAVNHLLFKMVSSWPQNPTGYMISGIAGIQKKQAVSMLNAALPADPADLRTALRCSYTTWIALCLLREMQETKSIGSSSRKSSKAEWGMMPSLLLSRMHIIDWILGPHAADLIWLMQFRRFVYLFGTG